MVKGGFRVAFPPARDQSGKQSLSASFQKVSGKSGDRSWPGFRPEHSETTGVAVFLRDYPSYQSSLPGLNFH